MYDRNTFAVSSSVDASTFRASRLDLLAGALLALAERFEPPLEQGLDVETWHGSPVVM